jgi:hypothetical protein
VRTAVRRLEVPYPVVLDLEYEIWGLYGNLGWPARYLFNREGLLFDYHYGEGGYAETERAIQELLDDDRPTLPPRRPEDAEGAQLVPQSEDVEGPYSGPYEAGEVWAVLDGVGSATANGVELAVDGPGCYRLISHPHSTAGRLELSVSEGVRCHAVCFTPGLAPQGQAGS